MKIDIEGEWQKIKDLGICSQAEFNKMIEQNPQGKCFRKYTHLPWSKDNFFFGTYDELQNYYKTTTEPPFYLVEKIGSKVGYLTIEKFFYNENHELIVQCKCDCGKEAQFAWKKLHDNDIKSCGCKKLAHSKGPSSNSIAAVYGDFVKENWDYDKNTISPEQVSIHSKDSFWWKGFYGSYLMPISALNKKISGTSFPEQAILFFLKKNGIEAENKHKVEFNGKQYEVDVYLPNLKIAIEYDGINWHKDKFEKDQEKNYAMDNNGIYFIRVREHGLKNTDIKNGYEIINEENLNDYEFIAKALTQIFVILNKICYSINQVKFNGADIIYMRKRILHQYVRTVENNNICKSWLFKYWSNENEVEAYLINERSVDKFWFNTFCGKIYESPFNIQIACMERKNIDSLIDLFKNDKACPFDKLSSCPREFNCFSKYYKSECKYYTGAGNYLNYAIEDVIRLTAESILTKSMRREINEDIEFLFYEAKEKLPIVLLMIIDKVQNNKDVIISEINKAITNTTYYKSLNNLFVNEEFLNVYCDNYDFDKLFNKSEIFLNLSKEESIYSVVYAAILYKNFLLLQNILEMLYKKLDSSQYNVFIINVFLQFYTSGKEHLLYPFIKESINYKILYDILLKHTSAQTKKFINRALNIDLTEYRKEILTQYVDTLIEKNLIPDKIKQELYYRLSDLPQIRDDIAKKIDLDIKNLYSYHREIEF